MKRLSLLALAGVVSVSCAKEDDDKIKNPKVPVFNGLEKVSLKFDTEKIKNLEDKSAVQMKLMSQEIEILKLKSESLDGKISGVAVLKAETQASISNLDLNLKTDLGVDAENPEGTAIAGLENSIIRLNKELSSGAYIDLPETELKNKKEKAEEDIANINTEISELEKNIAAIRVQIEKLESNEKAESGLSFVGSPIDWVLAKWNEDDRAKENKNKQTDLKKTEDQASVKIGELVLERLGIEVGIAKYISEEKNSRLKKKLALETLIGSHIEFRDNLRKLALKINTEKDSLYSQLKALNIQETELLVDRDELNKELSLLENTNPAENDFEKRKLAILKVMSEGKTPEDSVLIDAVIAQNLSYMQNEPKLKGLPAVKDAFKSVSQDFVGPDNHRFKTFFEQGISTEFNAGAELIYNSNFWRVTDPIEQNRIQCYSGTNLFAVLNSFRATPEKSLVFIYTKGHVLPGYIIGMDGKLQLVGIEMTAGGLGKKMFGPTETIGGEIRVFDAKQVMLAELFRDELSNFDEVKSQMIETMKIYGFVPDQMKAFDRNTGGEFRSSNSASSTQLNQTAFGFGKSNENGDDKPREPLDLVQVSDFQITVGSGTGSDSAAGEEPVVKSCSQLILDIYAIELEAKNCKDREYFRSCERGAEKMGGQMPNFDCVNGFGRTVSLARAVSETGDLACREIDPTMAMLESKSEAENQRPYARYFKGEVMELSCTLESGDKGFYGDSVELGR